MIPAFCADDLNVLGDDVEAILSETEFPKYLFTEVWKAIPDIIQERLR